MTTKCIVARSNIRLKYILQLRKMDLKCGPESCIAAWLFWTGKSECQAPAYAFALVPHNSHLCGYGTPGSYKQAKNRFFALFCTAPVTEGQAVPYFQAAFTEHRSTHSSFQTRLEHQSNPEQINEALAQNKKALLSWMWTGRKGI